MNKDISVTIAGVKFDNPFIAASGTVNFGRELSQYVDLNEWGGISVKALTADKTLGNPPPRIAESKSGMLNSVGLQNPGVDHFIKYELPNLRTLSTKIIANIAGKTVEEYVTVAEKLGDSVDMLELNLSCPNVEQNGTTICNNPALMQNIISSVKKIAKAPVIAKLAPILYGMADLAKVAQDSGADCLSLINTVPAMRIDVNTKRPILGNVTGGLSGPAILPIAIKLVYEAAKSVDIPIIGMGGISTYKDVQEFMCAGAVAVQIGTANIVTPNALLKIKSDYISHLM